MRGAATDSNSNTSSSNSSVIDSRLDRDIQRRKLQHLSVENSHSHLMGGDKNSITGDNNSIIISEDNMNMNGSGNNGGKREKQLLQLEKEGTEGRWLVAFFTPKRIWLLRSIAPATRRELVQTRYTYTAYTHRIFTCKHLCLPSNPPI